MQGVLIDTDILSYYMKKVPRVVENVNLLQLSTNNVKDYENIDNLEIINWKE